MATMAQSPSLVVVSCYTRFDNLAHGPKGTEAKCALYTFSLDPDNGQMVLLSVTTEPVMNPAFSRFNPWKNVLYTVTESVAEDGEIISWSISPTNGKLTKLSSISAGGTSTCYVTLDKERRNMLIVNYWDSTIGIFGMSQGSGEVVALRSMYDPKMGKPMKARSDKHVNHSDNDAKTQAERRADPHSHAVILDPVFGQIAFVPDLGMDLIRQFLYSPEKGTLEAAGTVSSGPSGRVALGPRYIEFHPTFPIAYVINELSSEVSVFFFDRTAAEQLVKGGVQAANASPTLRLVQTISTIPEAFPGSKNTCGRISVHAQGQFVLVSNRGHDSITVFRVHDTETAMQGQLSVASIAHTRGATPRHFQFDSSGQWLIVANQDSDSIDIFNFNLATGKLVTTGQKFAVPSPNFVCAMKPSVPSGQALNADTVSVVGRNELVFVHQSSL